MDLVPAEPYFAIGQEVEAMPLILRPESPYQPQLSQKEIMLSTSVLKILGGISDL